MAEGLPDYTESMELKGAKADGSLVTVKSADDGSLYIVVVGSDGINLVPVAVDASGQIIVVPRGQSGNYMSVDASGFLSTIIKGSSSGSLVTVAVDATGHILGVLQGDYAGALKTLAVDSQGRMQTLPRVPAMQMLFRIAARDSANFCSLIASTYRGISRLLGQTLRQGAVTAKR